MMTVFAAGCGGGDAPADYQVLGTEATSLRSVFNAGEGKVRALFIASPT